MQESNAKPSKLQVPNRTISAQISDLKTGARIKTRAQNSTPHSKLPLLKGGREGLSTLLQSAEQHAPAEGIAHARPAHRRSGILFFKIGATSSGRGSDKIARRRSCKNRIQKYRGCKFLKSRSRQDLCFNNQSICNRKMREVTRILFGDLKLTSSLNSKSEQSLMLHFQMSSGKEKSNFTPLGEFQESNSKNSRLEVPKFDKQTSVQKKRIRNSGKKEKFRSREAQRGVAKSPLSKGGLEGLSK